MVLNFDVRAIWRSDRPGVKIKNHGLGQYGAEPHYSMYVTVLAALCIKGLIHFQLRRDVFTAKRPFDLPSESETDFT